MHLQFIFASPNGPDSPCPPVKRALPPGGDTAICAAGTTEKQTVRSENGESYLSSRAILAYSQDSGSGMLL